MAIEELNILNCNQKGDGIMYCMMELDVGSQKGMAKIEWKTE